MDYPKFLWKTGLATGLIPFTLSIASAPGHGAETTPAIALDFNLGNPQLSLPQILPTAPSEIRADDWKPDGIGVVETGAVQVPPITVPTLANGVDQPATKPTPVKHGGTHGTVAPIPHQWWSQGSNSPIAIAIGYAEGTRQPDGAKNRAYYWHTDPGNRADNFGTFSYQHFSAQEKAAVVAQSTVDDKRCVAAEQGLPELADARQLKKLQKFHNLLVAQAEAKGMHLSQLELLNGLDLANQSEAAALSVWGYIDRLAQMKQEIPHDREEQILEARTWSYWDPDWQDWDAPGLGNTYANIRWDQQRRLEAVKTVLARHQGTSLPPSSAVASIQCSHSVAAVQPPPIAQQSIVQQQVSQQRIIQQPITQQLLSHQQIAPEQVNPVAYPSHATPEEIADHIILQNLENLLG
jgi:hypothetical protein